MILGTIVNFTSDFLNIIRLVINKLTLTGHIQLNLVYEIVISDVDILLFFVKSILHAGCFNTFPRWYITSVVYY